MFSDQENSETLSGGTSDVDVDVDVEIDRGRRRNKRDTFRRDVASSAQTAHVLRQVQSSSFAFALLLFCSIYCSRPFSHLRRVHNT